MTSLVGINKNICDISEHYTMQYYRREGNKPNTVAWHDKNSMALAMYNLATINLANLSFNLDDIFDMKLEHKCTDLKYLKEVFTKLSTYPGF